MISEMSKNWWLFLVRGLVAIAFGVLAIVWPATTWMSLVVLFGIFALIDGAFTLVAGIDFIRYFDRGWAVLVGGAAGIAAGLLTLMFPGQASHVLYSVIAAWAIVTGMFEIVVAARIRFFIPGEWAMVLAGILSILCGVLLFVYPGAGVVALVWVIAIYAIAFGVTQLVFSSRLHSLQSRIKQSGLTGI